jgi:hypothetical protein
MGNHFNQPFLCIVSFVQHATQMFQMTLSKLTQDPYFCIPQDLDTTAAT